MKKVKDIFSYSVGWGSSGIMCSFCKYSEALKDNNTGNIAHMKCNFHNISLDIMVNKLGHIQGEYFCKNFDSEKPFENAIQEFKQIKPKLEEGILYEACGQEYLCMIPFWELKEKKNV